MGDSEKMDKKRMLTGDRPTGPMHLGHYVGSIKNRVKLQDEYDSYFIIYNCPYASNSFDFRLIFKKNFF